MSYRSFIFFFAIWTKCRRKCKHFSLLLVRFIIVMIVMRYGVKMHCVWYKVYFIGTIVCVYVCENTALEKFVTEMIEVLMQAALKECQFVIRTHEPNINHSLSPIICKKKATDSILIYIYKRFSCSRSNIPMWAMIFPLMILVAFRYWTIVVQMESISLVCEIESGCQNRFKCAHTDINP